MVSFAEVEEGENEPSCDEFHDAPSDVADEDAGDGSEAVRTAVGDGAPVVAESRHATEQVDAALPDSACSEATNLRNPCSQEIAEAEKAKLEGNVHFKEKRYDQAAEAYSLALSTMPVGHAHNAIFLSNRAACYLHQVRCL